MSEANTFTLRKVKWASLVGVKGVLTHYYECSFKVKRVTAVKAAHFTLRRSFRYVTSWYENSAQIKKPAAFLQRVSLIGRLAMFYFHMGSQAGRAHTIIDAIVQN